MTCTGSTPNPYQFTGEQYDPNLNLYYLRARWYHQGTGRFLTMDTYPVNVQDPLELNRYGYTANNPVNAVDPSGLLMGSYGLRLQTSTGPSFGQISITGKTVSTFFIATTLAVILPITLIQLGEHIHEIDDSAKAKALIQAAEASLAATQAINNPLTILYRGTSLVGAYRPIAQLWVTPSLGYAAFYSDFNANADRSSPVIAVYTIPTVLLQGMIASGTVEVKFGRLEYGFWSLAQRFLIGPVVVPVPRLFQGY